MSRRERIKEILIAIKDKDEGWSDNYLDHFGQKKIFEFKYEGMGNIFDLNVRYYKEGNTIQLSKDVKLDTILIDERHTTYIRSWSETIGVEETTKMIDEWINESLLKFKENVLDREQ